MLSVELGIALGEGVREAREEASELVKSTPQKAGEVERGCQMEG
jgi:hypothetical protein